MWKLVRRHQDTSYSEFVSLFLCIFIIMYHFIQIVACEKQNFQLSSEQAEKRTHESYLAAKWKLSFRVFSTRHSTRLDAAPSSWTQLRWWMQEKQMLGGSNSWLGELRKKHLIPPHRHLRQRLEIHGFFLSRENIFSHLPSSSKWLWKIVESKLLRALEPSRNINAVLRRTGSPENPWK